MNTTSTVIEHFNTVVAAIKDQGLDMAGVHVCTGPRKGWESDARILLEVSTGQPLIGWAQHLGAGRFAVTQGPKGTNLHFMIEGENLGWMVWLHVPGVVVEELLPGATIVWMPASHEQYHEGFRDGRITLDNLCAVAL